MISPDILCIFNDSITHEMNQKFIDQSIKCLLLDENNNNSTHLVNDSLIDSNCEFVFFVKRGALVEINALIKTRKFLLEHPHRQAASGINIVVKDRVFSAATTLQINPDYSEEFDIKLSKVINSDSRFTDFLYRKSSLEFLLIPKNYDNDSISIGLLAKYFIVNTASVCKAIIQIIPENKEILVDTIFDLISEHEKYLTFSKHYILHVFYDRPLQKINIHSGIETLFPISKNYEFSSQILDLCLNYDKISKDINAIVVVSNSYMREQINYAIYSEILNDKCLYINSCQFDSSQERIQNDIVVSDKISEINLFVIDLLACLKINKVILFETNNLSSKIFACLYSKSKILCYYPHVANLFWNKEYLEIHFSQLKQFKLRIITHIQLLVENIELLNHHLWSWKKGIKNRIINRSLNFIILFCKTNFKLIIKKSDLKKYNSEMEKIYFDEPVDDENYFIRLLRILDISHNNRFGLNTTISKYFHVPARNARVKFQTIEDCQFYNYYTNNASSAYSKKIEIHKFNNSLLFAFTRINPKEQFKVEKFRQEIAPYIEKVDKCYLRLHPRSTEQENKIIFELLAAARINFDIVWPGDEKHNYYYHKYVITGLAGTLFEIKDDHPGVRILTHPSFFSEEIFYKVCSEYNVINLLC